MSRTFEIGIDPFGTRRRLYYRNYHKFDPGLTVLTGCNGSGKTTLMTMVHNRLDEKDIPCISYNNVRDRDDGIWSIINSEGENVIDSVGKLASKLKHFLETGEDGIHHLCHNDDFYADCKERWILLDGVDSGLSIDAFDNMKTFLDMVIEDGKEMGLDVYILFTTNSYEMCKGTRCYDVHLCKYITINSYEEYYNYIMDSAKKKQKSIETAKKNINRTKNPYIPNLDFKRDVE